MFSANFRLFDTSTLKIEEKWWINVFASKVLTVFNDSSPASEHKQEDRCLSLRNDVDHTPLLSREMA